MVLQCSGKVALTKPGQLHSAYITIPVTPLNFRSRKNSTRCVFRLSTIRNTIYPCGICSRHHLCDAESFWLLVYCSAVKLVVHSSSIVRFLKPSKFRRPKFYRLQRCHLYQSWYDRQQISINVSFDTSFVNPINSASSTGVLSESLQPYSYNQEECRRDYSH